MRADGAGNDLPVPPDRETSHPNRYLKGFEEVQDILKKHAETHLLLGFGSGLQYDNIDAVLNGMHSVLEAIKHRAGKQGWLLMYGGDAPNEKAPCVGLLAHHVKEKYGCRVLAPTLKKEDVHPPPDFVDYVCGVEPDFEEDATQQPAATSSAAADTAVSVNGVASDRPALTNGTPESIDAGVADCDNSANGGSGGNRNDETDEVGGGSGGGKDRILGKRHPAVVCADGDTGSRAPQRQRHENDRNTVSDPAEGGAAVQSAMPPSAGVTATASFASDAEGEEGAAVPSAGGSAVGSGSSSDGASAGLNESGGASDGRPERTTIWGGVFGDPPKLKGLSKLYLDEQLLKRSGPGPLLTSVLVAGGGKIALMESQYAVSRGVPCKYFKSRARRVELCGEHGMYGPVDAWAEANLSQEDIIDTTMSMAE